MTVDSPEDLYGLPLTSFIPERAALVKALRTEKRREEATRVAAMRKPSVAAWAVNQLVRTQSETIRDLFKAGDDLAAAQSRAVSGEQTAEAPRAATGRQRNALDDLLKTAEGLLSSDGHPLTAPTLERVRDTLRAASIDGASREQVADGCLPQELQFAGIGIGGLGAMWVESLSPRATKPKQTQKPAANRRGSARESPAETGEDARQQTVRESEAQRNAETAREAEATAVAEAARRRKVELRPARQTEAKARRAATRAEKDLAATQTRHTEAVAALQEADERLAAAAARAKEAASELENAERLLGDLDGA